MNFPILDELKGAIQDFSAKKKNFVVIKVENEEIHLDVAEDSFQGAFTEHVHKKDPRFTLYRHGSETVFFVYTCPEGSKVKERMLYSTVKGTILQFVNTYELKIDKQVQSTDVGELDQGYFKDAVGGLEGGDNEDFMTEEEKMLEIEKNESASFTGGTSTGRALTFPIEEEYKAAVEGFKKGKYAFVSAKVENEKISLDCSETSGDVNSFFISTAPRFSLLRFDHDHEGKSLKTNFFVYCCPEKSKIKDKMIYSSVKGNVLEYLSSAKIVAKSVESSDHEELVKKFFYDEAHPKKYEKKHNFKRAKRPGRGFRRPKRAAL